MNPFEKYLTPENKLQRSVARWLRAQYPNLLWWHTPNEAQRTKFERWLANVLGMRAGVSDIIILHANKSFHGLVIELKIKPNKPTAAQLLFLESADAEGYYACVAYNIEQVMSIVNKYMNDK